MILFIVILLAVCTVLFFLTQVIMLYKDKDLTRKDFTISGMMENLKEDDIAHNRQICFFGVYKTNKQDLQKEEIKPEAKKTPGRKITMGDR